MKELSIVTSLYKSSVFLDDFVSQCHEVVTSLGIKEWELVMVNDGSPDDSLAHALTLKDKYPELVIVNLSRNFGHHYALLAGISVSKGSWVMLIDCDLEVKPEILREFWQLKEQHPDISRFYGVQDKRKGGFIERVGGSAFYTLYNKLSETHIHENILTESMMSRQFADEVVRMGDVNLFLEGMFNWVGFKQMPVVWHKTQRATKSTYTFRKRVALSLQAVTSFSAYPLRILFHLGVVVTICSFLLGLYMLVQKLVMPEYVVSGYTSMIVVILFSTGIIVLSLGILGIYIERLFSQTKGRQRFIIEHIYE